MTALIILVLVGGACLAVATWGLWASPSTRNYLKRIFNTDHGR